ncbi:MULTISPECIES: glycoside hydrolase family 2 protein [unclassified Frondihabitans]|uniref:glycoside hydrolase family 2 protein n=1 Tax=unclassified Frondihabitans TaxID=2626248 RepID=UPI000FBB90FD|nr:MULTISPECIES: glycoside hydrolase family 2 TIM barrel-domain containing protein [unclassified Frondihabitans]RPE78384.1 glycosyl hydrolase family 2 [Frondihabitans sp. PhB153]RPF08665.1 glycosyl hydrolase family 2 [Frondihabitans sp. PhB161]
MSVDTLSAEALAAQAHDAHYPRPQLIRRDWQNLDGVWRFAIDDDDRGLTEQWWLPEHAFPETIIVPFPPESKASGIGVDGIHDVVWYQREISWDDVVTAGYDENDRPRLVLHFGAVDYRATVWLDGAQVAQHEGGHTPFSIVVPFQHENAGHTVTVRAEDYAADVGQPRGKQDWQSEAHVIWYRRTTGIWQSVWLEATPAVAVEKLHWTADVPGARVICELRLTAPPLSGDTVRITLTHGEVALAEITASLVGQRATVTLDLPRQANGQDYERLLWSPENPALITADVTVGRDRVVSYFGLRMTSIANRSFLLNERPVYIRSVLSQGFWPTSHLAAPSPESLRDEVAWILRLGFNSARVHQKMEDPRFLYWADRLGLMLWAEAPAAYEFSSTAVSRTTREWLDVVDRDRSHPSIVTWVPMNESWGIQHIAHDPRQVAFAQALTALTRAIDPTRPVISNDGWEHVDSDIFTVHDYDSDQAVLTDRYADPNLRANLVNGLGPAGRRMTVTGSIRDDAPVMVTEFGGITYSPGARAEDAWGYSSATSANDFQARLLAVYEGIRAGRAVVGSCYTQLTDTMQEANGLLTEDRIPKLDPGVIRAIVQGGPMPV